MCTGRGTQVWTYAVLRSRHGRRQIERRVRGGTLLRVRRGVYATDRACVEVVTAATHGGVLGCESAARHLGLWVLDEPALHVWMHHDRHQYPHEDCRCVTHWDAATSSSAFEQPGVPLVLRQIYGCRGPEAFFVAVESARRLGLIDEVGLRRLGDRLGAEGRDHRVLACRRRQRAGVSGAAADPAVWVARADAGRRGRNGPGGPPHRRLAHHRDRRTRQPRGELAPAPRSGPRCDRCRLGSPHAPLRLRDGPP
ncbi:protein of unknown function [Microbacterium sp. Nx66]|nr:protein of unknown function [Microbacterium sp. Nx66]